MVRRMIFFNDLQITFSILTLGGEIYLKYWKIRTYLIKNFNFRNFEVKNLDLVHSPHGDPSELNR